MIFMGGKGRWAKKIVAEIEPWRTPGDTLIEVCCGAANLTEHWTKPVIAYDLNPALITMWKAAQAGWRPPPRDQITKELFIELRSKSDVSDPLTAFVLFGCSFRGQWAAGYASPHLNNGKPFDPVSNSIRSFARKAKGTSIGIEFLCGSYADVSPLAAQVVYADPPYLSTRSTGISGVKRLGLPKFDHDDFWSHVRSWNVLGAHVFVSEEVAPCDFVRFRSWNAARALGNWSENDRNGPRKLESIWVHRNSAMAAQANGDTVIA